MAPKVMFWSLLTVGWLLFGFDFVAGIVACVRGNTGAGITGLVLCGIGGAALTFLIRERAKILS